jgi:hypothetical protein
MSLKKLIFITIFFVALYYSINLGRAARLSQLFFECSTPTQREKIDDSSLSREEKLKLSTQIFTCAKERENNIDRLFKVVPKAWATTQ